MAFSYVEAPYNFVVSKLVIPLQLRMYSIRENSHRKFSTFRLVLIIQTHRLVCFEM
jgi:hypothetical protein